MSEKGGFEIRLSSEQVPIIKSFLFNRDGKESCPHIMRLTVADIADIRATLDELELHL